MIIKYLLKSTRWLALVVVASGFVAGLSPANSSHAYTEPTGAPPTIGVNEIPTFLNGSALYQRKLGGLMIGTTANPKKLCLNPDIHVGATLTYPAASDPNDCYSSWSALAGSLIDSTQFLRRLTTPTHNTGSSNPALDTIDNGYINLQALSNDGFAFAQLITVLAEANPASTATAPTAPPTAIFANGVVGSNYAATFAGRLGVFPDGAFPSKICLNDLDVGGNPSTDCISRWSDVVVASNPDIVRLQNLRSATAPATQDLGNTALGGDLVAGSLVAGSPVVGTNITYSCGDGICSSANETKINCSLDCP